MSDFFKKAGLDSSTIFFHYFWKQTKYNTLEFSILWWNQWIEGRRSWFFHEAKPSFILQCEPNERNAFSAVQWTEGHHQFCLLLLQVTSLLINNSWYYVINNILCRRKPCLGLLSVSLICRNISTQIASTSVYTLSIVT